ncbi:hypothetical protein STENM36S_04151 [Streptomyces tendae]
MECPSIRLASAAAFSRAPPQSGQRASTRKPRTRSRVFSLMPDRSRLRYSRSNRSASPSYSVFQVPPEPLTVTLLPGRPRIRNARSAAVKSPTGLCTSSSPVLV